MLRLGIKEFFRRIYTNVFTALQLAVVFLILLAIVSSVKSRTELYLPIKNFIKGDGIYTTSMLIGSDIINEKDLMEKYPEVDSVISSYTPDVSYMNGDGKIISYPDDLINRYAPKLESGRWFANSDLSENTLYGVASYGSGIKVNDTVVIDYVHYDESDTTFTHPIEETFNVKIIGVLSENAQVYGADTYTSEDDDFRNLYGDYDESKPLLLLSQKQLIDKGVGYTINLNKQIIKYKEGLSDEQIENLNNELGTTIFITLDDFRSASELHVYEQIIKLMPILICIALLVIVSTVSISALNVKSGLRTYSIFYVCGSSRSQCLGVCLVNSILTAVMAIAFAVIAMNAGDIFGLLSKTVISTNIAGIFACGVSVILQIVCSMVMPVALMSRETLKDNLNTNE